MLYVRMCHDGCIEVSRMQQQCSVLCTLRCSKLASMYIAGPGLGTQDQAPAGSTCRLKCSMHVINLFLLNVGSLHGIIWQYKSIARD